MWLKSTSLYFSTEQVVLLPRSPSTSKTYFPIPVDNLEEEYRIRSADDGKLFREEYNVRFVFAPFCYFKLTVGCLNVPSAIVTISKNEEESIFKHCNPLIYVSHHWFYLTSSQQSRFHCVFTAGEIVVLFD